MSFLKPNSSLIPAPTLLRLILITKTDGERHSYYEF